MLPVHLSQSNATYQETLNLLFSEIQLLFFKEERNQGNGDGVNGGCELWEVK